MEITLHLAWKERVRRESKIASRFYKLHDHLHGSHYTYYAKPRPRVNKQYPAQQTIVKKQTLAEVRGKYARQACQNPRRNSVVVKPSTAGSLKGMNAYCTEGSEIHEKVDTKVEENTRNKAPSVIEKKRARGKSAEIKRRTELTNRSIANEKIEVDKKEVVAEDQENKIDSEEDVLDLENDQNEENDLDDDLDKRSWITTSSHRQYIEHLEELLKEEKKRRIRAEKALKDNH